MIYKIFLIDADNGISLLEVTFKAFKESKSTVQDEILAAFFNAVNIMIDKVQEAMAKGRRMNEMTRVLESEESTIIIYYHPLSRVLFSSISDADDDTEKIKVSINKIGNRFWKKHKGDLKVYRTTTEKNRFDAFKAEIENLSLGGRIAEIFPKILIIKSVLEKILSMGMINELEFKVALKCNGQNSPLKISRICDISKTEINDVLKKLEQLDIIRF
ncbi:MAG: hypothetical protein EU532_03600 [Promethearchaeota archaeon]|nr:MAG: hypothetical protein EU532_03600 [Candidatus Lokiarchaeota archaeon]